jgi:1-acyl-sn-glycerol-3-phosphate acyltransferase
MKYLSGFLLWLAGWRIKGSIPPEIKKCVILAAPHTSNWDFVLGRLAYFKLGVPVKFLIKKEVFVFPFKGLITALGGIPVDRGRRSNLVEEVAYLFELYEQLNVVIAPEGTRKRVDNWKRGFYFIAQKANVPLALGFIDYKTKTAGFGPLLYPSGNFESDFRIIEDFYKNKTARHPEMFNLSPQNAAQQNKD